MATTAPLPTQHPGVPSKPAFGLLGWKSGERRRVRRPLRFDRLPQAMPDRMRAERAADALEGTSIVVPERTQGSGPQRGYPQERDSRWYGNSQQLTRPVRRALCSNNPNGLFGDNIQLAATRAKRLSEAPWISKKRPKVRSPNG
jgi:hypothetical protein